MSILRVKIKYKKQTDMSERLTASLTIRLFIDELSKSNGVSVNEISDLSCDISIDREASGLTKEDVEKRINALLSEDFYDISVEEPCVMEERADTSHDRIDTVMAEIQSLIGAESFKLKAEELLRIAPKIKRLDGYLSDSRFLFSIDDGNGLTKVAQLLAELLFALGLIGDSRVVELEPVPYVTSQADIKQMRSDYMKLLRNSTYAGMVIVDLTKCYNHLGKVDYREFLSDVCSMENIPMIIFRIPYLEEHVIRAVEENLQDQFFLHSVSFVPLNMDELYCYAQKVAEKYGYSFDSTLRSAFDIIIAKEKSDGKFYGFRTIEKVVHHLIYQKVKNDNSDSSVISVSNLDGRNDIVLDGSSAEEQLEKLCGLESVIEQLNEIVSFIEYAKDKSELVPSFHMRFIGNPGTGKTTVARILGKILKEKGILRTGVFFEYTGNDFVAQYVGHTAPKVAQICRDAYGGVLFIDEAYGLTPGKNDLGDANFKREALNTLLAEMENHRSDMVVIFAGYEDQIETMMKDNPGLSQRVPYTIKFDNFTKEELTKIFFSMAEGNFTWEKELENTVREYFDNLPNNIYYSPTFSNARYVRNIYERTVSKAVLRASLNKEGEATLICDDFTKAVEELKNTATASVVFGKDECGAAMFNEEIAEVDFSDVCGQEEAKETLSEMVDFLRNPTKYKKIGATVPRGALLYGPPGTGKTMLAKAVAGEAGVPVLAISGSNLISSLAGEGAKDVSRLFEKARKIAPSIIFIDEIDSIGMSRGSGYSSDSLMQLLSEMDGFDKDKTVIVLAATNRPEVLDPALKRPGRFDREIPVELPDLKDRVSILAHYLEETRHEENINLREIGNLTTGFSGAQMRNIVNEAAHRALRQGRDKIIQDDLTESVETVAVGYVKKNRILSDREKWIVCYHEIGHALMSALQTHTVPVKKITVVPRTGGTLGYVMHADNGDKSLLTKSEMENSIAVCVAGRAAEEIHFGEATTGASNDIQKATKLARSIVADYGMTDEFDMVCFDTHEAGTHGQPGCSEETARLIDAKVVEIVREQHKKALHILKANEELLDELARYIYHKETVTGEEFMKIFNEKMKAAE